MQLTNEQKAKLEEGGFLPHVCLKCGTLFYEVPDVRAYCENCINREV